MSESTKEKLLDAAERLIAEQGVTGTSLRQVVAEAGVNLASVHYHFGSKDELLHAMVSRRAGPVNERRLGLLDQYEAEAGGGEVAVEKILWAFLEPMGVVAGKNPQFVRVMGRIIGEGLLGRVLERNFPVILERFSGALRRSLKHLPEDEFRSRIAFMTGVVAHTMHSSGDAGFAARIDWMIRFLTGGFMAPATEKGVRE